MMGPAGRASGGPPAPPLGEVNQILSAAVQLTAKIVTLFSEEKKEVEV
jgi:hypothetical protein